MSHPGDLLQAAIWKALTDHAGLKAAMGGTARVYDRVPGSPVFPYITIGPEQVLDDGNACDDDVFECFADVHVWTDAVGVAKGKVIAAQVYDAMKTALILPGWTVHRVMYESERHFPDSDGLRGHGVLTFKINLETA